MSIIIFIFIMFQIFQSPFKSLELNKLALIYNYTLYVTSMCLVLIFSYLNMCIISTIMFVVAL